MQKSTFKAHPLTVFILMRSYWFVFASPILRIIVEYIACGDTKIISSTEALAASAVIFFAICGWASIKIDIVDDLVIIKRGVFIKSCSKIAVSKASDIYLKRNFLDILFKSVGCFVGLQAYNNGKSNFKIKLKHKDANKIFPQNINGDIYPVKSNRNRNRFFLVPMLIALILVTFKTVFLGVDGILVTAIFLLIDAYYAVICYYNYKKGQLHIQNNIYAVDVKGFSCYRFFCDKNKVGVIKIFQTPTDRQLKTCKIKITAYSEDAKSIKIKNSNLKNSIEVINKELNLKIRV